MIIVIDANIVISFLIKPYVVMELLLRNDLEVYSPDYLLEEIEDKLEYLFRKKGVSEDKVSTLFNYLKKHIRVVRHENYKQYIRLAKQVCPDDYDVPYFALCLYLKCPLWSNDKALKEKQDKIRVYPTHELITLLGK